MKEKKSKNNQEWSSSVLRSIGDALIATDKNGSVVFMNPFAEELTGWKQEEAKGKAFEKIFTIIDGESEKAIENPVKKTLRDGKVFGMANHTILVTKNGTKIPINDSGSPLRDENGNVTGVVLVFRDTTAYKKQRDSIIQAKKEWEETFDTISDAITIHDKNFNIIRTNKAAVEMLGLSFSKILGQKCFKSYHGTKCPPKTCPSCQTLKTGKPTTTEFFEKSLNKYLEIKALR